MSAAAHLRVVDPDTGELHETCPGCAELRVDIAGFKTTVAKQARHIGKLERDLERYAQDEPDLPQNREAVKLGERWKRGTDKPRAVIGATRIKLVKARLKDGYPLMSEEWLPNAPTLELAVDGLCSYPYESYGRRYREDGPGRVRRDDFADALKDEAHVEKMARLGYLARARGWVWWA